MKKFFERMFKSDSNKFEFREEKLYKNGKEIKDPEEIKRVRGIVDNAFDKARKAFRLAEGLGPPTYSGQNQLYRILAENIGPEVAEKLGLYYRKYIPEFVRTRLRR